MEPLFGPPHEPGIVLDARTAAGQIASRVAPGAPR